MDWWFDIPAVSEEKRRKLAFFLLPQQEDKDYNPLRRKWYAHVSLTVKEKLIGNEWVKLIGQPLGSLSAGIDLGVNNLMAVYVENGESFLVNGRPLKSN